MVSLPNCLNPPLFLSDLSIFNRFVISCSVSDIGVPGVTLSPEPIVGFKLLSLKIDEVSSEKNSNCLFLPSCKPSLFVISYTVLNTLLVSFPVFSFFFTLY